MDQDRHPFPSKHLDLLASVGTDSLGGVTNGDRVPKAKTMVNSQGLPDGALETNPGAAQEGSETRRSGEPQKVSAGSPVAGEKAGEQVSASATPTHPHQQIFTATSITSHSSARPKVPTPSNRLCAQRPQDPPHVGMKRKCSTQGGDAEGEGEEETLFYMKVRAMNGVSVTWETRTGFRAISKRPRLFKANYTGGESFAGSDWSSTHTKSDLGDVELEAESSVEEQAEEQAIAGQKMSHMDIAPLPIMQGVRCLACCRLFPSLEALIEHVKHGLREGFSCRVYNRVLGQFRARKKSPRRSRRLRERGHQLRRRACSRCGRAIRLPCQAAR